MPRSRRPQGAAPRSGSPGLRLWQTVGHLPLFLLQTSSCTFYAPSATFCSLAMPPASLAPLPFLPATCWGADRVADLCPQTDEDWEQIQSRLVGSEVDRDVLRRRRSPDQPQDQGFRHVTHDELLLALHPTSQAEGCAVQLSQ